MTTQQPNTPAFSIAELGAKFGEQLAQAYAQIITLEKQLAAQALTIQQMVKHEAALFDDNQDLEAELIELRQNLETMINEPYREQAAMLPEAAALAQQGKEAIGATKKPLERAADD